MTAQNSKEDDMTPEARLAWLRERGVQIETPEERKAGKVASALQEAEAIAAAASAGPSEISYVRVPADTSKPLQELTVAIPRAWNHGDYLMEALKSEFQAGSQNVDLSLLQSPTLASSSDGTPNVSDATLRRVAQEAHVESFSLVHPTVSNQFTGVNLYLDEIGMLKRLPQNTRATDFAKRSGYDPPPQFFGDVFLGRVRKRGLVQNLSFVMGLDTAVDAPWLQQAMTDNLEHQMEMNRITGRNETQGSVAGTNGIAQEEQAYSWTQTEEEIELVLNLPGDVTSKSLKVNFRPQTLQIMVEGEAKLDLQLFEKVDVDGCTWTIDRTASDEANLAVTLEKVEQALWPRIMD